VRSVHGLSLDDLDATRRYHVEFTYLSPDERALALLIDEPDDTIYTLPATNKQRAQRTVRYIPGNMRPEADNYPKLKSNGPDRN
jgi:hypothetical protein